MRRRGFLKGLFGAATVAVVGKGDGVSLTSIPHPHLNESNLEEVCRQLRDCDAMVQKPIISAPRPKHLRWVSHQALEEGKWDAVIGRRLDSVGDMWLVEYDDGEVMTSKDGTTWTHSTCDCDDGPHGTACSNRNVLKDERLG